MKKNHKPQLRKLTPLPCGHLPWEKRKIQDVNDFIPNP
jgi:hypothetical protein